MSTVKLSKSQITKIIKSGRFLCNMIRNLAKKEKPDLAIYLAKENLPG